MARYQFLIAALLVITAGTTGSAVAAPQRLTVPQRTAKPADKADFEKTEPGYQLVQKSRAHGLMDISMTANGVRINNLKSGVIYVSTAPKWEVSNFSARTRTYCRTEFNKFAGFGLSARAMFGSPVFNDFAMKRHGSATVAGHSCGLYVLPEAQENKQVKLIESGAISRRSARSARLYLAERLAVSKQIGQIISRIYGLPPLDGVPLKFTYYTINGVPKEEVGFKSLKKMSFKKSFFQVPRQYKSVPRGELVFEDEFGTAGMSNMLENLGKRGEINVDDTTHGW